MHEIHICHSTHPSPRAVVSSSRATLSSRVPPDWLRFVIPFRLFTPKPHTPSARALLARAPPASLMSAPSRPDTCPSHPLTVSLLRLPCALCPISAGVGLVHGASPVPGRARSRRVSPRKGVSPPRSLSRGDIVSDRSPTALNELPRPSPPSADRATPMYFLTATVQGRRRHRSWLGCASLAGATLSLPNDTRHQAR